MGAKQNRRLIGILIIALSLFGSSIGIVLQSSLLAKRSVVLEPTKVVLTEDPLEGEFVKVPLVLRNYSNRPVSVLRWIGSCGCMDATVRGGRPLLRELSLPAGGTMPWQLVIDTRGYAGVRHLRFAVDCEDKGQHVLATSELEINVRPGMRIEPRRLFFSDAEAGHTVKSEFMVLDALPDPGTEILRCVSSAPSRLSVSLERLDDREVEYGDDIRLRARYRGLVSYTPPASGRLLHDWISVVPKGGDNPIGTAIAVVCSTRRPAYAIVPHSLVLAPSLVGPKCLREFRCFLREDAKRPLRIHHKPEWLEVSIRDLDSATVAIDILAIMETGQERRSDDDVVFSAGIENEPVLTLPVRLLSLGNVDER